MAARKKWSRQSEPGRCYVQCANTAPCRWFTSLHKGAAGWRCSPYDG